MGVSPHGTSDGLPGVEYRKDLRRTVVAGVVSEALDDTEKEILKDDESGCPIADVRVVGEGAHVFTWHVDNGYVTGYKPGIDRRTDIGRINGFYSQ
jgi:hypothetical protein